VPVYDVLEHDEYVVLVMELVQGTSLREWAAAPRSLGEVLRVYLQVAEGLVAVHHAGLVHRDIKPDNLVIGSDGRVRMIDFGLAVDSQTESKSERGSGGDGTPRYSAPEQLAGESVGEAADIYAFSVSLKESLNATGREIPGWLARIVEKGSNYDPADRLASAAEMLRLLRRGSNRGRRIRLAGLLTTAIVVSGASAFWVAQATSAEIEVCNEGSQTIAATWTAEKQTEQAEHLTSLASPYALSIAPVFSGKFNEYAQTWAQAYDQACRSRLANEGQGLHVAGLRARCLAQSRVAFETLIELVTQSSDETLPDLVAALSGLPTPSRCNDEVALLADGLALASSELAGVDELAQELATLRVYLDAASPLATKLSQDALAHARSIGDDGWLAQALLLCGRAHLDDDNGDRGAKLFEEAMHLGLRHGNLGVAAEAFARRMWAQATTGTPPDLAQGGLNIVESLIETAPELQFERALLANNQVVIAQSAGKKEAARIGMERAAALADQVSGQGALELLTVYTNQIILANSDASRARAAKRAESKLRALLGAEHPRVVNLPITQAMLTTDADQAAKLLVDACARLEASHPHRAFNIADCWYERGMLAAMRSDDGLALASLESSQRVAQRAGITNLALLANAQLLGLRGEIRHALALIEPAIGEIQVNAPWYEIAEHAELLSVQASLYHRSGDRVRAREIAARAESLLAPIAAEQDMAWLTRRHQRLQRLADARE
jgi:hypothetical protein